MSQGANRHNRESSTRARSVVPDNFGACHTSFPWDGRREPPSERSPRPEGRKAFAPQGRPGTELGCRGTHTCGPVPEFVPSALAKQTVQPSARNERGKAPWHRPKSALSHRPRESEGGPPTHAWLGGPELVQRPPFPGLTPCHSDQCWPSPRAGADASLAQAISVLKSGGHHRPSWPPLTVHLRPREPLLLEGTERGVTPSGPLPRQDGLRRGADVRDSVHEGCSPA